MRNDADGMTRAAVHIDPRQRSIETVADDQKLATEDVEDDAAIARARIGRRDCLGSGTLFRDIDLKDAAEIVDDEHDALGRHREARIHNIDRGRRQLDFRVPERRREHVLEAAVVDEEVSRVAGLEAPGDVPRLQKQKPAETAFLGCTQHLRQMVWA